MKKSGYIILIIVLIAIGFGVYWYQKDAKKNQVSNQTQNQNQVQTKPTLYNSDAVVKAVSGNDISADIQIPAVDSNGYTTFHPETRDIKVTPTTEFYTLSKTGTKQAAVLSSIKVGSKLTVFSYSDLSKNNTVEATSIQITK